MSLHHVIDIDSLIVQFSSLLKINGKLCIIDLMPDDGSFHKKEVDFKGHNGFDPIELSVVCQKNNFIEILHKVFYTDTRSIDKIEVPYNLFILLLEKKST